MYTCALLCSRVSVGHHGCPAPEAVTTAATGAAEPAGDRERASAGDLTRCRTARWASWPACIGRSCTSAPGTCCGSGSVQGGCPRGAQDPRRHLGHWAEAHGWRPTSWLDGPPILPYPRRLLRKAPKAVRLGDPEQRPRPLLQGHPGGRGAEPRRRHRGGRAFGMKSSRAEDFVAAIKHRFVYSTSFSIPELFPGFTGILSSSLA